MKRKNLNAKKITLNFYRNNLKKKKVRELYKKFKRNFDYLKIDKICVLVSGGPDSLALLFLLKCYSLEKKIKIYCYLVDHKIREGSTLEAKKVKLFLRNYLIDCKILVNKEKITPSNLQSKARLIRYNLAFKESKKNKIKYIFTGHHRDDLYENFFIRLVRGSGLKGLVSFHNVKSKIKKESDIKIIRPLINFNKNQLKYIVDETFIYYVKDPMNNSNTFLRSRIREMILKLGKDGLKLKKLEQTLLNLADSDHSIDFYVKKNIAVNVINKKDFILLNSNFFENSSEVVFRSLNIILLKFSKKNNYVRGKKLKFLINWLENETTPKKLTLSGCIFEKTNNTVLISRENDK